MKKKKKLYIEKYGNLNVWKKHTLRQKFFSSFQNPKKDFNNMPFGVPVHTYMEELQPCLTGLFQGNERYLKN